MDLRNIPKHFLRYFGHEAHTGIQAGYSYRWTKELQDQTCPRRYIDWSFRQVPAWVGSGWSQRLIDDPWMVVLASHSKAWYPGYRDSKHHR